MVLPVDVASVGPELGVPQIGESAGIIGQRQGMSGSFSLDNLSAGVRLPAAGPLAAPLLLNEWARGSALYLSDFQRTRQARVYDVEWGAVWADLAAAVAGFQATDSTWQPPNAVLPAGEVNTLATFRIDAPRLCLRGHGDASEIVLACSANSPALPVIDIGPAATGAKLLDFAVQANGNLWVEGTVYGGDPGGASAILAQADDVELRGLKVQKGYNNGIFGIRYVQTNGVWGIAYNQGPVGLIISNIRTLYCGAGNSTSTIKPGHNGAGIDIGGTQAAVLSKCVDRQSYSGFVLDINAGVSCIASDLYAYRTQLDGNYPTNGSGTAFYLAGNNCQANNLYAMQPGGHGFWLDYCDYSVASNLTVRDAGGHGALIKGNHQVTNLRAYHCSQSSVSGIAGSQSNGSGPLYNAIQVEAPADLLRLYLTACFTEGTSHKYGYLQLPILGTVTPWINGGNFEGLVASTVPPPRFTNQAVTGSHGSIAKWVPEIHDGTTYYRPLYS